jgi:hypothetical protein
MKISSSWILGLTGLGFVALSVSPVFFDYPVFGWIIAGVMLLVFLTGQERYRRVLTQVERDEADLVRAKKDIQSIDAQGLLSSRIAMLKECKAKNIQPDAQVFSEILSARESANIGKSAGSTVILLGLIGTFFGLMLAISDAGKSLDSNSTGEILGMIRNIFLGMRGVFGTSLSGLLAAILLNISYSAVSGRQMSYMAAVEEFTQFVLIPKYTPAQENAQDELLLAVRSLEKQMESLPTQLQNSFGEFSQKLEQGLGQLPAQLGASIGNIPEQLEKSLGSLPAQLEAGLGNLPVQLQKVLGDLPAQLRASIGDFPEQLEKSLSSLPKQLQLALSDLSINELPAKMQATMDELPIKLESGLVPLFRELPAQIVGALQEQNAKYLQELSANLQKVSLDMQRESRAVYTEQGQELLEGVREQSSELLKAQQEQLAVFGALQQSVSGQLTSIAGFQEIITDAVRLMKTNQAELQSSIEMFTGGVEHLLDALGKKGGDELEEAQFIDKLQTTLTRFHERASDALVENAMQTQEILLEVMNRLNANTAAGTQGSQSAGV